MNFLITMDGHEHLARMAANFKQHKVDELNLMKDSPHEAVYLDMVRLNNRGLVLREFQEYTLQLTTAYHRVMDDDDLIESLASGTADPDFDAVIKTICSIEAAEPWAQVLSLIPINFEGGVAAILTKKPE